MDLGIAGAADTQIRGSLLQLPHQIRGMAVIPAAAVGMLQFFGDIAPQGHDIGQTGLPDLPDPFCHSLPGGGYTGQMGQRGNAVKILDIFRNVQRVPAGTAACAVGHAHKRGFQGSDSLRGSLDAFEHRLGFWREHFKGDRQGLAGKELTDFHSIISLPWVFFDYTAPPAANQPFCRKRALFS